MSFESDNMPFLATVQVALNVLEGINTPRSLSVFMLADHYLLKSYDPVAFDANLKMLGFNINWYDQYSVESFRSDYCATSLLTKLPSKDDGSLLVNHAISSFKECEESSREVTSMWLNESKVESMLSPFITSGLPLDVLRNNLHQILGRAPSLKTIINRGYFTDGASVCNSSRRASAAHKCVSRCSVTRELARALTSIKDDSIFNLHPLWRDTYNWFLSPGNLVCTVPKNITTNRTIAMEPEINQFCQRSIGDCINRRLKVFGVDLNNQRNNQYACSIARQQSYATIDLKNASNSVNARVVETLLPPDWWYLVSVTRSQFGSFDKRSDVLSSKGSWFEYQMLSSMGNGFTFELESALFLAICMSIGVPLYDTYVYGDDIIIPQAFVNQLIGVLGILGFSVNAEKSFTEGAFFESCGVFIFNDVDVTPFKIKELLYGDKDCVVLANKIRWFSHSCRCYNGCDKRFLPAYRLCVRRISANARTKCRGPLNGSITLWSNMNEVRIQYSRKRASLHTYHLTPVFSDKPRESDHEGLLNIRLFEQDQRCYGNNILRLPYALQSGSGHRNVVKTIPLQSYSICHLWYNRDSWYEPGE